MEDYSRRTPAPAVNGNQYQQYWYYERTRGQYNQGKMKFKPRSSQMKQYETRYPEKQVIKMVDLAKYMEIYEGKPHTVSKGKQALVKIFATEIKAQWEKSDEMFNDYYFKRVVALAIIFRRTDEIVRETTWFKKSRSYKANVIAYTMSIIFHYIRKNKKEYSIDFMRIWNLQDIYPGLREQIEVLCTEVYEFITAPSRETENVTEWCKKELCWEKAQNKSWTITQDFLDMLILKESIQSQEKEAKRDRRVENEVDDIKFILSVGKEYWQQVVEWGSSRRLLSDMEKSLLKMAMNIGITGRIPSDKQVKAILKARERMISEGMPLQF